MANLSIGSPSTDSGFTVLAVVGDLDLFSAPRMSAAGRAALEDVGCPMLVLDLTALSLIDSTGIGTLVGLHTYAREHGQRLVLRGVSERLTRVLTIAGLTSMFDIEPGDANPPRGHDHPAIGY